MPVEHGQASAYAKEMVKHEAHHTHYGAPQRPYVYREFPKAVYRFKRVDGKGIVKDEMHIVNNELEQRNMQSRGFHLSQEDAIKAIEREHTEHGKLAAEREWQIRHGRVSDRATAEVRAAEEAHGAKHLPDVPETPIPAHRKKRGRPAKAAQPVEA